MIFSKQYSVGSFQLAGLCKNWLFFVALVFSLQTFAQGFKIPETPKFQTSVYDYVNLLSASQKTTLESKLVQYSDTTSTQIVVAIIALINEVLRHVISSQLSLVVITSQSK